MKNTILSADNPALQPIRCSKKLLNMIMKNREDKTMKRVCSLLCVMMLLTVLLAPLMDETCTMDVRMVRGAKNLLLGGEGLVDTVITGPGKVYLQTMTVADLARLIIPFIPEKK